MLESIEDSSSDISPFGHDALRPMLAEFVRRRRSGEAISVEAMLRAYRELMPELEQQLLALDRVARAAALAECEGSSGARRFSASGADSIADSATLPSRLAGDFAPALPPDIAREWLARSLSGYEILDEIKHGGQGVVYGAVQKSTRRAVAIKIIHRGPFCGARERTRFTREVGILGRLNHPNIVTIHDSGVAAGCFYYVMDRIAGQPLDEYVRRKHLSTEQIILLFATVCDAVTTAHLLGIIHRDLKPGNILVDDAGRPFILDFGLAAMQAGDDAPATMTLTAEFVGSLPWAAPEQFDPSASPPDVRTDVYSLGVILYELLTGQPPYELKDLGMVEAALTIREVTPIRPSARDRALRGDLDWIVMKCLEKDRARRYQTASAIALDIQRQLAGEPVMAAPPTTTYRARRFIRRHRAGVAAAATIVVALIAGLASTIHGMLQAQSARQIEAAERARAVAARDDAAKQRDAAERARDSAEREAAKARALADFFERTLASADPIAMSFASNRTDPAPSMRGAATTMAELLRLAAREAGATMADQPPVEARARVALGRTMTSIGMNNEAVEQLERALALQAQRPDTDSLESIETRIDLAEAVGSVLPHFDTSAIQRGIAILRPTLDQALAILSPDDLRILRGRILLGELLMKAAAAEGWLPDEGGGEPVAILTEVIKVAEHCYGPNSPITLRAMITLASYPWMHAIPPTRQAELVEGALARAKSTYGENSYYALAARYARIQRLMEDGHLSDALVESGTLAECALSLLGPTHELAMGSVLDHHRILVALERNAEATEFLRAVVDPLERGALWNTRAAAALRVGLIISLQRAGQCDEAGRRAHDTVQRYLACTDDLSGANLGAWLGTLLVEMRAPELSSQVSGLAQQILAESARLRLPPHSVFRIRMIRAANMVDRGENAHARVERLFALANEMLGATQFSATAARTATDQSTRFMSPEYVTLKDCIWLTVDAMSACGPSTHELDALDEILRDPGFDDARYIFGVCDLLNHAAWSLWRSGAPAQRVLPWANRAAKRLHEWPDAIDTYAVMLYETGQAVEAEAVQRRAIERLQKTVTRPIPVFTSHYGAMVWAAGRREEGERILLTACEQLLGAQARKKPLGPGLFNVRYGVQQLVKLYTAAGEPDKAADWRQRLEQWEAVK